MNTSELEVTEFWTAPRPAAEGAASQREALPVPAAEAASPGLALGLSGVGKSFGAREVLRGIDLQIEPGEFVAIVGRSGCGKSTLLRLLAGLESLSAGAIALGYAGQAELQKRGRTSGQTSGRTSAQANDKANVQANAYPNAQANAQANAQSKERAQAGQVRVMFQDARLLPWKRVLDNVALGLERRDATDRAREALTQVGLAERVNDWPAVLSGGQRQRVALARALVHTPKLLLLDEPLGALDALTRIEMQRLIESLWRRHRFTALLVTHDVGEAVALADRVLLIEDGRLALDEPVPLARPRSRGDARYAALEERILNRVLQQPELAAAEHVEAWPSAAHQLRWAI